MIEFIVICAYSVVVHVMWLTLKVSYFRCFFKHCNNSSEVFICQSAINHPAEDGDHVTNRYLEKVSLQSPQRFWIASAVRCGLQLQRVRQVKTWVSR